MPLKFSAGRSWHKSAVSAFMLKMEQPQTPQLEPFFNVFKLQFAYSPQFQNIFYFYTWKPKLITELISAIIEWPHKQNSFWESSGTSERLSGIIAVSSLTDLDLQKAPRESWYKEAGSLLHTCTFQVSNPAEWGHWVLERHLRELN